MKYTHTHKNEFHVQMDFLGSIRTDKKSILTMTIPHLHYVMLFLCDCPNQDKITTIFNTIQTKLGTKEFATVFPYILTDRDPCFSDFNKIKIDPDTSEIRTHLFYCDSFNSSQKANVEQMNKQLRLFFPKGKSIEHHTKESVKEFEQIVNNSKIQSLSKATPTEAFISVYGEKTLNVLKSILI